MAKKKRVAWCEEGKHYPTEIVATIYFYQDRKLAPVDLGIICDGYGKATNRWEDGGVVVFPQDKADAESDESPVCAAHRCCEVEWRDDPVTWTERVQEAQQ